MGREKLICRERPGAQFWRCPVGSSDASLDFRGEVWLEINIWESSECMKWMKLVETHKGVSVDRKRFRSKNLGHFCTELGEMRWNQ